MANKYKNYAGFIFLFFCFGLTQIQAQDSRFVSFTTEPSSIKFYWKDNNGQILRSIQNLKSFIETQNQELKFATNGGMYLKDNSPQGLYIENGATVKSIDTLSGTGNFYLKPNGIFFITKDDKAIVCENSKFIDDEQIKFATQSGPMLLIDGEIHPAFKQGSKNLNIRNGVGILPDNKVIFAISTEEVNLYDFAEFLKKQNCKNALYLDGFVSRAYIPGENWKQLDGNFGVMIGVSN